jgi:hypothetical protein
LPRAVISAVTTSLEWNPRRARHEMGEHVADLPQHIARARAACQPVDGNWLIDRLSTMQLAMTNGWSEAKATAWLHEMQRLLADLPQDLLSGAIDQAIQKSERGFMPTVGEVRAIAEPRFADRQRILRRLEGVAALPAEQPAKPAREIATPEQVEAIKAEVGLVTEPFRLATKAKPLPTRKPTRDDYIALGVDPAILDQVTEDSS